MDVNLNDRNDMEYKTKLNLMWLVGLILISIALGMWVNWVLVTFLWGVYLCANAFIQMWGIYDADGTE